MNPKPTKPVDQQLDEAKAMARARDEAQGTPLQVRQAFLAGTHKVPGLELSPWSIGIMWLLEEIGHPLLSQKSGEVTITAKDAARALYIFSGPLEAYDSLAGGLDMFDREAIKLACSLPPASSVAANALIPKIIQEGLSTIPGAGNSNPPETGS